MFTLFDNLSPAVNEKQFDSIVVKDSSILNEMKWNHSMTYLQLIQIPC